MSFGIPFGLVAPPSNIVAIGGMISYANRYKIHTLTSSGSGIVTVRYKA